MDPMNIIDMPAGSTIRLMATARPHAGVHRWDVRLFPTPGGKADSAARPAYGSRIGGDDRQQQIDMPAQDTDCRLEISCQHRARGGWEDDCCVAEPETPGSFRLDFCDPGAPGACQDDVSLTFVVRQGSQ
jgi:hypothetical protein